MRRLWIDGCFFGGLAALLSFTSACSVDDALDYSEKLTIAMVGAYEQPEGAQGQVDPKFINVTFHDASLIKDDGTLVDLYAGDPVSLRIINRPQIVQVVDMSAYAKKTLSGLTVSFDPSITAESKSGATLSSSLITETVTATEPLTVEKASQKRLTIRLLWKNTITFDDTVDPPIEILGHPGLKAVFSDE